MSLDNLRHAQYTGDGIQIDDPQSVKQSIVGSPSDQAAFQVLVSGALRVLAEGCPNTVFTDHPTTGIGVADTQAGFVTIKGGTLGVRSRVEVSALFGGTGGNSKNIFLKAGPATGNYATAVAFGGQSGLSTHRWMQTSSLIYNNGTLAAQILSPFNSQQWRGSTTLSPVSASIDTALDWNIYFGVQMGVSGGGDTMTLSNYTVNLIG